MHGYMLPSNAPAYIRVARALLFWGFVVVAAYALRAIAGGPPPDQLHQLGVVWDWYNGLLDANPASLRFGEAETAPPSGLSTAQTGLLLGTGATVTWIALLVLVARMAANYTILLARRHDGSWSATAWRTPMRRIGLVLPVIVVCAIAGLVAVAASAPELPQPAADAPSPALQSVLATETPLPTTPLEAPPNPAPPPSPEGSFPIALLAFAAALTSIALAALALILRRRAHATAAPPSPTGPDLRVPEPQSTPPLTGPFERPMYEAMLQLPHSTNAAEDADDAIDRTGDEQPVDATLNQPLRNAAQSDHEGGAIVVLPPPIAEEAGGEVAEEAGGEVAEEAGGEVAEEAGGEVAEEAGGEVAEEAGGEAPRRQPGKSPRRRWLTLQRHPRTMHRRPHHSQPCPIPLHSGSPPTRSRPTPTPCTSSPIQLMAPHLPTRLTPMTEITGLQQSVRACGTQTRMSRRPSPSQSPMHRRHRACR